LQGLHRFVCGGLAWECVLAKGRHGYGLVRAASCALVSLVV